MTVDQTRHLRNIMLFLNALFDQQSNFKNDLPGWIIFYTWINKGRLRKARGYSSQNVVSNNNKDEDDSLKNDTQNIREAIVLKMYKILIILHTEHCAQTQVPVSRQGKWSVFRLEGIPRRVTKLIKKSKRLVTRRDWKN